MDAGCVRAAEERLSLFQRCCLQQLPLAYAYGRAEGEDRADGAGDFGCADLYPDCSLADLYDETTMPPELRKAHQENDKAVMRAYGFDIKTTTETSCVAELMRRYQELVERG